MIFVEFLRAMSVREFPRINPKNKTAIAPLPSTKGLSTNA